MEMLMGRYLKSDSRQNDIPLPRAKGIQVSRLNCVRLCANLKFEMGNSNSRGRKRLIEQMADGSRDLTGGCRVVSADFIPDPAIPHAESRSPRSKTSIAKR